MHLDNNQLQRPPQSAGGDHEKQNCKFVSWSPEHHPPASCYTENKGTIRTFMIFLVSHFSGVKPTHHEYIAAAGLSKNDPSPQKHLVAWLNMWLPFCWGANETKMQLYGWQIVRKEVYIIGQVEYDRPVFFSSDWQTQKYTASTLRYHPHLTANDFLANDFLMQWEIGGRKE